MSGFSPRSSNVLPLRRKPGRPPTSEKEHIRPLVDMSDGEPERFADFAHQCRTNNGQCTSGIKHLFGDDFSRVSAVTVVEHRDGTPAALDMRFETKSGKKGHRLFFRGWSVDPKDHRREIRKLHISFNALAAFGLLLPVGLPDAFAAQDEAKAAAKQVIFYWVEGAKTREAVIADRLPALAQFHESEGLVPAVLATLCGLAGVQKTNYAGRPGAKVDPAFTLPGVNDIALDLAGARHVIVIDNDMDGREEASQLSFRLQNDYGVPVEAIAFVDPPSSAPEGWDDADDLPWDVSPEMRLQQFIEPRPEIGWETEALTKAQGGGVRVIQDSNHNRYIAVRSLGLSGYVDIATGAAKFSLNGEPFAAEFDQREKDRIADKATRLMGRIPTKTNTEDWSRAWRDVASEVRDLIEEEMLGRLGSMKEKQ